MTRKSVHVLIAAVVGLLLLLVVVQRGDRIESLPQDRLLLPGFKQQANDVTRVEIQGAGDATPVELLRVAGRWTVRQRDGYTADFSKLSQLIIALAEARTVEEKTSNPERYAALGVDDPANGGQGTLVTLSGDDFGYAVILGERARSDFRYARVADEATSYLVDRIPPLPEDVGGWLQPDIVDIGSQRVRKVSIAHEDGEIIVIEKESEESADFSVLDIPQGRELSYETVANGTAGALSQLELQDVRAATDAKADTTVVFETWDGLTVRVGIASDDESSWLSFGASTSSDDTAEADAINERLSGWQFRIAEFKIDALTRRWDDILKAS